DVGYIGLAVHTTARVCAATHGGQIVVSSRTRGAVGSPAPTGIRFRTLGRYRLPNLPALETLFQVQAKGLRGAFPKPRLRRGSPRRSPLSSCTPARLPSKLFATAGRKGRRQLRPPAGHRTGETRGNQTEVAMSNPSPSAPGASSAHAEQPWLIVFADLTRFMVNSRSTPALTLAGLLDGYYRHAEGLVAAARGRVVKFMGDAFLAVWPEAQAGEGVAALPAVKRDIDAWWAARGWDSRVVIKAHFGRAAA